MRMTANIGTPRTLRAVLWDMDGTLIDTEPLWMHTELKMLERYGLELPEEVRQRLIGSGLQHAAGLFQNLGVPLARDEIVAEWVRGVGDGLRESAAQWRPGAIELLTSLQEAAIPSALVTMSVRSFADQVLELLPAGMFQAVVSGDDVAYEKPDPDPYLRGAAALGVPIEDCLAFEDSPTGLSSASASGAVAIGIPNFIDLTRTPAHELWATLAGHDADSLAQQFTRLRTQSPTTQSPDHRNQS